MEDTLQKIHFHPGFYGAAELEFRNESAKLEFNTEYNLGKEELMHDIIVQREEEAIARGMEKGIISNINLCRKFKMSFKDTIEQIMQEFDLSEEDATNKVKACWI